MVHCERNMCLGQNLVWETLVFFLSNCRGFLPWPSLRHRGTRAAGLISRWFPPRGEHILSFSFGVCKRLGQHCIISMGTGRMLVGGNSPAVRVPINGAGGFVGLGVFFFLFFFSVSPSLTAQGTS